MKTIVRAIFSYTMALFLLPFLVPGIKTEGGFFTLLSGGVALTVLFLIVKPIINIISFPVNFLTLGLFSSFINSILLYLLTVFVTGITISAFTYPRSEFFGFIIPNLHFNLLFAYIFTGIVLSFINSFFSWLSK